MQLWAIQTKLAQEDSTKFLVDAFQKLGLNWAAFPVRPFDHRVPDFGWEEGPIVYYGSTGLIQRVHGNPALRERARLFYDDVKHRPSWYGARLGEAWLNHEAQTKTVWEVFAMPPSGERFFVRPDSGLKVFAGHVSTLRDFRDLLDRHRQAGFIKTDDTVWMNQPLAIEREYRTWIIGGEVAAVVGYRRDDRVNPWEPFDAERAEIFRYAEEQGRKLAELEAFVLDVARMADGSMRVVEVNDIHASGFYLPEHILDVVAEWSNFVVKYPHG